MQKSIIAMALGLALILSAGPTSSLSAAPACKGKAQGVCTKTSGCRWVGKHKRKGKEVKGYCRSGQAVKKGKRTKKAATKKPARKKAATKPARKAAKKKAADKKAE